jgi:5'(3')-deoxyribonucleotidase
MDKQKIYLDIDNTITNSTKAFVLVYNTLFKSKTNFIPADWQKVDVWSFQDQCTLLKDTKSVEDIFKTNLFFSYLEFINENTYEIIKEINEEYNIILVSIGTFSNISLKAEWCRFNLPCIKEAIFLVNANGKMNKSAINMSDGIIIDDVASNLESSNAKNKICFGERHQWNRDYQGNHCLNWTEIRNFLL